MSARRRLEGRLWPGVRPREVGFQRTRREFWNGTGMEVLERILVRLDGLEVGHLEETPPGAASILFRWSPCSHLERAMGCSRMNLFPMPQREAMEMVESELAGRQTRADLQAMREWELPAPRPRLPEAMEAAEAVESGIRALTPPGAFPEAAREATLRLLSSFRSGLRDRGRIMERAEALVSAIPAAPTHPPPEAPPGEGAAGQLRRLRGIVRQVRQGPASAAAMLACAAGAAAREAPWDLPGSGWRHRAPSERMARTALSLLEKGEGADGIPKSMQEGVLSPSGWIAAETIRMEKEA